MQSSLISVVIPCFNESEVIAATYQRLQVVSSTIQNYELIFVDDGSLDNTLNLLKKFKKENHNITVIGLSRNFGHQIAVTAGIEAANGDAVIVIDADLQDPPEIIPEMIKLWADGADVVYCVRKSRAGEAKFKLFTAKIFYRILGSLSDINIPHDTGDFRLIDRKVVTALSKMPEKDRYLRGMVSWIGFNQVPLYYDRDERMAGETKYPLKKMIKFALDGIFSFSTRPLQISTYFGILVSLLSLIGVFYAVLSRLLTDQWIPGWTLLFIGVMFLGGVQLIILGVIGEYVGRIYGESKKRPLYLQKKIPESNKSK